MKFYYNGQLVRTSKNHEYTHAVIDITTGECRGCRVGADKADAIIRSEISRHEKWIAEKKKAIAAIKAGKSYYMVKDRGHSYKVTLDKPYQTIEWYEEGVKGYSLSLERIKANWKVVELEAR